MLFAGAASPAFAMTVSAAEETGTQAATSGTFGNITWEFDTETKTLTLSGTGSTGTYYYPYATVLKTSCPWGAFRDALEKVVVSEGITEIGDGLFSYFYYLKSVQLPESLTAIGTSAFANCFCLTEINIPESVTKFGANAFYETAWLNIQRTENRNFSRPALISVNDILIDGQDYGSYSPSTTLSVAELGTAITAIGDGAFLRAQDIGAVDLTNTIFLTDIGEFAFEESSITSVVLPRNVNHIGMEAFAGCSNLTEVTIQNAFCEIYDHSSTISNSYNGFPGTIRGYTDSTAQAYAEKYGCKFESIGDAPEVKQGDFNGDEQISLDDAQGVLQYYTQTLAGKKPLAANALKQSADVNGDGAADIMDAQYILKYYTENSVAGVYTAWEKIIQ